MFNRPKQPLPQGSASSAKLGSTSDATCRRSTGGAFTGTAPAVLSQTNQPDRNFYEPRN
ncbi:MAG: hypothetical protein SFV17_17880 [Candidatus Obscuribacter sp.]|nr:hypothetical protein [Candidatus Melainabacteria bacterium]MDX1988560.1 hypothetical protein [Candidatus Obscuribacter sp.]